MTSLRLLPQENRQVVISLLSPRYSLGPIIGLILPNTAAIWSGSSRQ